MPSNIVVNFNINANATGGINIFGQPTASMTGCNTMVCSATLPVSDFFISSSNSLIKFQGSNDSIYATRNINFTTAQETLMNDIATVINSEFDCSNAAPFSSLKYNNVYNIQQNFGYVALAYYADKLFGHLGATAAITNDTGIVSYITSNGVGGANISSNLATSVFSISDSNATAIVKQVLSQDASRASGEDNDFAAPSLYQGLKFIAGDAIYMSATLQPPTVTYGSGQNSTLSNIGTSTSYLLKILLADGPGAGHGAPSEPKYILQLSNVDGTIYVVPSFDGVALTFPVYEATWSITYIDGPEYIGFDGVTGIVSGMGNGTIGSTYTFDGLEYPAEVYYYGYTPSSISIVLEGITLDNQSINPSINTSLQLVAKDNNNNDITSTVTWNSTNTSVVDISSTGYVNVIGYGSTIISAKYNGFTAQFTANIVPTINIYSGASLVNGTTLTVSYAALAAANYVIGFTAKTSDNVNLNIAGTWTQTNATLFGMIVSDIVNGRSYKLKTDTTGSSLITVSYLGGSSSFTLNVTA